MAKVLSAQGSGYFPSCLIEDPVAGRETLEYAMFIYWKVKSWTITISGDFPISTRTFTQTAPDETYLVCDNSGSNGNGFSPSDEQNQFWLDGFYVNSYSNPTLYGLVPYFYLKQGGLIYTSSNEDEFAKPVGTFTFSGHSYPFYRIIDEDNPPIASGAIEIASFWPYGQ